MRIALAILFLAAAARADQNDLQLWRLGHPDCLGLCDSTGKGGEPGDLNAQARFHRLASTLGLAFAPPFQETAGTLGQAGFEVGFSSSEEFLRIDPAAWPTGHGPPGLLTLPTVALRKGLGGSVELGAAVSWLSRSQMMALSVELRWAVLDGLASAPDVALRAWGTRVLGAQELDLASGGVDLQVSRSFGALGMMKLQPYGSFGLAMVNAVSNVVDFKPGTEDVKNPTADDGIFRTVAFWDNRYWRAALGVRLVAGAVVLGLEGNVAWGRNDIQLDAIAAGMPQNYLRLWGGSARLGFAF